MRLKKNGAKRNEKKKHQQQQGKRSTISKHPTNSKPLYYHTHTCINKHKYKHERRNES